MSRLQGSNRDRAFLVAPVALLRLEGAAVAVASLGAYFVQGGHWQLLLLLLFAPDLSMLAYLAGPRRGATVYNLMHSYAAPVLLAFAAWLLGNELILSLALIWLGHIGIDRALGYGLKLPSGFKDTHLGRIGRNGGGAVTGGRQRSEVRR